MVKAIVGANWGDEGKGKITDMLAEESDIIVRFQGGANAGHTIINDYGKFALHLLPSGVFYNHTTSVIGNGVALNIPYLVKELKSLTDRNVPMPKILVSDRAQILMPYHVAFDTYEEAKDLWYQGIESIMEKNAKEDAKKEDVQNTTDRFSMKDEEKDNIFQKDTLSKSEWAMFYSKIGEKKNRYYFPKAADGNYIMTINNKLVYTNGNWGRPRIDRIIEIDVDGVSGTERSTAISNIQEEFIEYEKNGREISEDIQRIESKNIEHVYGGRTYIQTYYRNNFATSKRKRAGRSVQLYDENNKISRNKAGRATADRISESERSGNLKEKFSLKEPVEEKKKVMKKTAHRQQLIN